MLWSAAQHASPQQAQQEPPVQLLELSQEASAAAAAAGDRRVLAAAGRLHPACMLAVAARLLQVLQPGGGCTTAQQVQREALGMVRALLARWAVHYGAVSTAGACWVCWAARTSHPDPGWEEWRCPCMSEGLHLVVHAASDGVSCIPTSDTRDPSSCTPKLISSTVDQCCSDGAACHAPHPHRARPSPQPDPARRARWAVPRPPRPATLRLLPPSWRQRSAGSACGCRRDPPRARRAPSSRHSSSRGSSTRDSSRHSSGSSSSSRVPLSGRGGSSAAFVWRHSDCWMSRQQRGQRK